MYIEVDKSQPMTNDDGSAVRRGDGSTTMLFRYLVRGNADEIANYRRIQGDKFRVTDNGIPLYFSVIPHPFVMELCISTKDKIFVDTTATDMAAELIRTRGELGKIMAMDILAEAKAKNIRGLKQLNSVPVAEEKLAENQTLD